MPLNDLFLRACRGELVERPPVWFMRQAGRSLPEYREIRDRHEILEIAYTPELAAEVTMQPVRRLKVDAAVMFADIVIALQAMGVELTIDPGVGPIIGAPVRTVADVERIRPLDEDHIQPVLETVSIVSGELDVPVIGFGGAPFTLASYLVEGGPSRTHVRTKALMYSEPEVWHKLMDRLAEGLIAYLRAQVRAGAGPLQLFDSWVGHLSPTDYRTYVLPHSQRIFDGIEDLGVPRIHFGVGTGELLQLMLEAGPNVIGVDWRVPLDAARARLGPDVVLQGNLDPAACLAPWHVVREKAQEVLDRAGGHHHVFNLGHGVLPETDPVILEQLVAFVHGEDVDD